MSIFIFIANDVFMANDDTLNESDKDILCKKPIVIVIDGV